MSIYDDEADRMRRALEHQARCDAAMERYRATGISHSTDDVIASLQAQIDARREQLRGKRRTLQHGADC